MRTLKLGLSADKRDKNNCVDLTQMANLSEPSGNYDSSGIVGRQDEVQTFVHGFVVLHS